MKLQLKFSLAVFFFLAAFLRIGHAFPDKPPGDSIAAIRGLVSRILGEEYANNFLYEVLSSQDYNGSDVFEVDGDPMYKLPVLRGNNGVALASAFNFYLKYWCNCSVSWGRNGTGDQLNLPDPFPVPDRMERKIFPNRFRSD